ncbi:helix-turn-helix domain-containing protein [Saccharibacillus alkalitolerans]|uniref:MerR family transcriptional regulator n=1 Tax=Saccharibacillus alkalitolerans TaxID=2705290 RepID=A0ABX0F722_9BACL|nr:MerR family transcriptional regulator [Saccharibacillus alkalitolerans]NGZ76761.1 MerR family transcriptional regulator [Saccharibacillus alkalitolerans]
MSGYKIDDVARETGLTKRAIRYYEEIGLIPPPERSGGGTRQYTRAHIEQLQRVISARDVLGFSLQEIQEYMAYAQELTGHRELYPQLREPERQLEKLREMDGTLDAQLRKLDEKASKILAMKEELERFRKRVTAGIARLEAEDRQSEYDNMEGTENEK